MQKYLNAIGWLYLASGAVALIAIFLVGLGVGRGSVGGTEFFIFMTPFIAVGIVGRGILDRKSWARIVGIVLAVVLLLAGLPSVAFCGYGLGFVCLRGVLVGGVMGAFALLVLFNKETKKLFAPS